MSTITPLATTSLAREPVFGRRKVKAARTVVGTTSDAAGAPSQVDAAQVPPASPTTSQSIAQSAQSAQAQQATAAASTASQQPTPANNPAGASQQPAAHHPPYHSAGASASPPASPAASGRGAAGPAEQPAAAAPPAKIAAFQALLEPLREYMKADCALPPEVSAALENVMRKVHLDLTELSQHMPIEDVELLKVTKRLIQDQDTGLGLMPILAAELKDSPLIDVKLDAAGFAELQTRAEQFTANGQLYKAYPIWCQLACSMNYEYGCRHPQILDIMHKVVDIARQRGNTRTQLLQWVVGRSAEQWGVGHPSTRKLVQQAAVSISELIEPRNGPAQECTALVMRLAQQLPGGLGWGATTVGPVPDQEAYNRHAVMEGKAMYLFGNANEGHASLKLAKQMFERCVTYHESLGQHWLGACRKVRCMAHVAWIALQAKETVGEGEEMALKAKRTGQRELGVAHPATLEATWAYGMALLATKRPEAALSHFQKVLRIKKEFFGQYHVNLIPQQAQIAQVLMQVGKDTEAEALLRDVFETSVHVHGPTSGSARYALVHHWGVMHAHPRWRGHALALRSKAEKLGCDLSRCQ